MPAEIEDLLKRTMGLDAVSIGVSAIERAVQQRLAACGRKDADAYLEHVRGSAEELQELVEAVIVPETWFFRDCEAFAALARLVGDEWLRTHPTGVLRVLSLPCSTGEEPYSMAMALFDAGIPAERFRIEALDISLRALAFARRGIFGRNSFRGSELEFRERFFTPAGDGWQLAEAVRTQVDFRPGNLLDAAPRPPGAAAYDIVFCRNLLIYFDRATQDRAIATLTRLLAPQGWLFVGPSETGLVMSHAFASAKIPLAFAFRQAGAAPAAPQPNCLPPPRRPQPPRLVAPTRELPFRAVTLRSTSAVAAPPAQQKLALDHAIQLADQGHLVEAAAACEAHVREHGPSAPAFYVLGLVRDTAGSHADAAEFYRKALYLDPQHHEALAHLAFLLDAQGDTAGAKVMTDRARRLEHQARK